MPNKSDQSNQLITNLSKWLSFLLNNTQCSAYINKNHDFQLIIKKEIYVLDFLVKKSKKANKDLNNIISQFNTIINTKLNLSSSEIKINEDEMEDFINYLKIYVKNIFHFDLEQAIKSPQKVTVKNPSVESNNVENINPMVAALGAMGGIDPNSSSITIPNPFLMRQAQENVRKRILNDEVFVFNSKPKGFLTLKWCFVSLIFLLSLIMLIISISGFMLSGKSTIDGNIVVGINITSSFNLISTFLFSYIAFSIIRPWIKSISGSRKVSLNEKYALLSWYIGFVMIMIVLYLINNLYPASLGVRGINVFVYPQHIVPAAQTIAWVFTGSVIGMFAIGGLLIILSVTLILIKPKENNDLIRKLMSEEMSKVSSGNSSSEIK